MQKLTDIFNSKEVRKARRALDIKFSRVSKAIAELDIDGKEEIQGAIEAAYTKAYKALINGIEPGAAVEEEPKADKPKARTPAKKSVPAKKSSKKKGGKGVADDLM